MVKNLFLSLAIIMIFGNLSSQDVHLSQFYTNALNLNPAMGGDYDGDYRLGLNYRNQWSQINDPITTGMFAFDKKFHFYNDELNAGLLFIQDEFSGFNLVTNKILISGAYKKQIGYNEFRAGVQFGMVLKSTNLLNQTFPNQWVYETGVFNQTVTSGELALLESTDFVDFNVGIGWSRIFAKFKPTIGVSIFHVNNPKDTYFSGTEDNLKIRKVIHGEAELAMNGDYSLEPKLLYMWTTKAQDMMFGANMKKVISDSKIKNVFGGLLYRGGFGRNSDAIIPVVGIGFKNVDFGFSYDVTISDLSDKNAGKSTIELSLIYTAPTFSPKSLSIPCDRY